MAEENPKFEIRNPKQARMTQEPMTETPAAASGSVLNFGFWSFEFVSDFEFRISDFLPGRPRRPYE